MRHLCKFEFSNILLMRWFLFILIVLIIDYYAFQSLRTITKSYLWFGFYWVFTIVVLGNFIFQFLGYNRSDGFSHSNSYAAGFLIAMIVPISQSRNVSFKIIRCEN